MRTAEECLEIAKQFEARAEIQVGEAQRASLELARQWRTMARVAERVEHSRRELNKRWSAKLSGEDED